MLKKLVAVVVVSLLAIALGPPAMAQHAKRDFMYQEELKQAADRFVALEVRAVYRQPAAEHEAWHAPIMVSEKTAGKKKAGDESKGESRSRNQRATAPDYNLIL